MRTTFRRLICSTGQVWAAFCAALLVAAQVHAQDSSGNFALSAAVPGNLRDGTATLDEARSWVFREASQAFPDTLEDRIPRRTQTPDLDLDGQPDLLVETLGGGSGGAMYAAFLATATGYRYVGGFQGGIVPVARMEGAPPRVVISSNAGGGCSLVQLVELKPDGMHRLTHRTLAAGDSGTDEGRRLYRAMFGAGVAPEAAVREVFARPDRLQTLLSGLVTKVPELVLAGEVLRACRSTSASFEIPNAGPAPFPRVRINIYTHDSSEEARQSLEATRRRPTQSPAQQELFHGRAIDVRDAGDSTLIGAQVGSHVIDGAAPHRVSGTLRKALQALFEELEE